MRCPFFHMGHWHERTQNAPDMLLHGGVQVVRANGTKVSMTRSTRYDGLNTLTEIFTPPFEIFPGDRIITTCIYNTTDRSTDLVWGEGTKNEMCWSFFSYYPAVHASGLCFDIEGLCSPAAFSVIGCQITG